MSKLPTGLDDAGNFSIKGHIAEANTADAEFSVVGASPAAIVAAIVPAYSKLGLLLLLDAKRFLGQTDPRFYLEFCITKT
jgi:hypothetical protein